MPLTRSPERLRPIGFRRYLSPGLVVASVLVFTSTTARAFDATTSAWLTHCGGCHGIEGVSGPTFVPMLRDQVGVFACSAEGRAWLVRVPGVSMSLIRDDGQLADVMNFVLFRLGGKSTPPGTKPYTAAEIHTLRQMPPDTTDLMTMRAQVLERALQQCPRHS